jgi:hypothetical protein
LIWYRNDLFKCKKRIRNEALFVNVNVLRDCLPVSAEWAVRIPVDRNFPEFHGQGIVGQQPAGQQFAFAKEELDGFSGLDGADNAGKYADDSGAGTGQSRFRRRRVRKDAAIAG